MSYRSGIVNADSGMTVKDFLVCGVIALGIAATCAVGATYAVGMQLGEMTQGFKFFFG